MLPWLGLGALGAQQIKRADVLGKPPRLYVIHSEGGETLKTGGIDISRNLDFGVARGRAGQLLGTAHQLVKHHNVCPRGEATHLTPRASTSISTGFPWPVRRAAAMAPEMEPAAAM